MTPDERDAYIAASELGIDAALTETEAPEETPGDLVTGDDARACPGCGVAAGGEHAVGCPKAAEEF